MHLLVHLLKIGKIFCMRNMQITVFLKHPASSGAAQGGSPKAYALAGRCFRKTPAANGEGKARATAVPGAVENWVSAHDAAVMGLAPCLLPPLFAIPLLDSDAEQVICAALEALTDLGDLIGGRESATNFPAGNSTLAHVAAVSGQPCAKLLLRQPGGLPLRG